MRTIFQAFELVKQTFTSERDCLAWSTDSKAGSKTLFFTNIHVYCL